MSWKQTDIHGNPPLTRDYLVVTSSNGEYVYSVNHYDYDQDTWFDKEDEKYGFSIDPPIGWMEFDDYEKLTITKFH